jgi:predicted AAA+ superfamily ATPase
MDTRVLESMNPWWGDGRLPERYRSMVSRDVLERTIASLSPKRAVVVVGPRRVGKTVLLHEVVGQLLDDGVPPTHIVYVSADDPALGDPASLVPELRDLLARRAATQGDAAGPTYLLVDEVHAITDWARVVKGFIDRGEPYVWAVTSSAGAVLHRSARESLAGRAEDVSVLPFSLAETARLLDSPAAGLLAAATGTWSRFGIGPVTGDLAEALRILGADSLGMSAELDRIVRVHLTLGGFPEFLGEVDPSRRDRYFWTNLVDRVLYQDIPAIESIRDPALMRRLLTMLITQGPALVNIASLSRDLGANHITIASYLAIIDVTMLDFILDRYAGTFASQQRGLKKSVPVDAGMVALLGAWDLEGADGTALEGHLAEVVVHAWLRRHRLGYRVTHWRDNGGGEVDFVLDRPSGPFPVEVKWRDAVRSRRTPGLDRFQQRFGTCPALTITRDALSIEGDRASIPLWMLG